MKKTIFAIMFMVAVSFSSAFSSNLANGGFEQSKDVSVQDQTTEPVNLYLYKADASTTIASPTVIDGASIEVADATGFDVGDVITIYENTCFFQSLVKAISGTEIGLQSPLDCVFSTSATVDVGAWKCNVDGSGTRQIFKIKAPSGVSFDIYTVIISITDNAVMDSAKFGGIDALTNGVVLRHTNGIKKNLSLVVNNIGFNEMGYALEYDPKAPSGVYGLRLKKTFPDINGIAIRINGKENDEFQIIINDNLSDLTHLSVSVLGHVVED